MMKHRGAKESMKKNHFFAMLSRMKYINRWGLMRNTRNENLCEHSLEVAYVAHALGIINNEIFGGDINAERLAVLGMYHDVTEIITGDMPTPIKYYNPLIRDAYKEVEQVAEEQMLSGISPDIRERYRGVLLETEEEAELWKYVKAADKISAYIKCIEEKKTGNRDFEDAEVTIYNAINDMGLPEVDYFMKEYIPAYMLTIDKSGEE
ncbi:MAG: 5'-deoxynucleotidase [Lachnospira sp.]|nr:5'-deoxynucleotidase [Lachnospira sp.]